MRILRFSLWVLYQASTLIASLRELAADEIFWRMIGEILHFPSLLKRQWSLWCSPFSIITTSSTPWISLYLIWWWTSMIKFSNIFCIQILYSWSWCSMWCHQSGRSIVVFFCWHKCGRRSSSTPHRLDYQFSAIRTEFYAVAFRSPIYKLKWMEARCLIYSIIIFYPSAPFHSLSSCPQAQTLFVLLARVDAKFIVEINIPCT